MNALTIIIIIATLFVAWWAMKTFPKTSIVVAVVLGLVFIPPVFSAETTPNATAVSIAEDGSYVTSAADPAVSHTPTVKSIEAPKKDNWIVGMIKKATGAASDPDGAWVHTKDAASVMSGSGSMSDYLGK